MPFLEFRGISKSFPGVRALDGVSFAVERGTCHALIGENGAGKSTLGKILAGVHTADAGEILLEGRPIRPETPRAARGLGIAIVHQELAFCPNLSVAENLFLGDLPLRPWGGVDRAALRARASALLQEIGAAIDPDAIMESLSTAQEQLVQIAGAVGTGARIIVMDEPTSSLTSAEAAELFRLVRELTGRGVTILFVSHRLEELFALCDWITVLRDGRQIATGRIADTAPAQIVRQMIGRELLAPPQAHLGAEPGEERLRVRGLSSPGRFAEIAFGLRAGEIVGLAGLVGAGRSEVAQAIFGLDPAATGEVTMAGRPVPRDSVRGALAAGLGFLPEDRKRQGLVLSMNCRENTSLAALPLLTRLGWVRRKAEEEMVGRQGRRLRVKAASWEDGVSTLSGGNQQKLVLAKWMARDCAVLIVDEPTRGIDVGAKAEIYQLLDALAGEGRAILVISSELPELMALSRRILVMRQGRLVGELPRERFSEDALMRLMTGLANDL